MSEPNAALAPRIGRQLRKVPGVEPLLEARVGRLQLKNEVRALRENRRREAETAAGHEKDGGRLRELAAQGGLKINVGCGPSSVEGWTNVDIVPAWEGVLYMDVTEPWPIPDGSVEAINSEHFIEHISLGQGRAYFEQAARALRPGGLIRTSTPDLRVEVDIYLQADSELLSRYQEDVTGWCEARNHSEMLNNIFFEWEHRHIYDAEAIMEMLEEAGFGEIERAEFGRSSRDLLKGIDTHHDKVRADRAFAVDAVKPLGS
jgi:predicted SAM-dependent methyltransferase